MFKLIILVWLVAGTASGVAAQPPNAQTPDWITKPLSLTGCNPLDDVSADRAMGSPAWTARSKYRTAAATALTYVGNGIRVVGGLVPSPNIAAQAGSLDPTVAAMAFVDGEQGRTASSKRHVRATTSRPFRTNCPPQ